MASRRPRSQDTILKLLKILARPISAQDLYIELRERHQPLGLATVYRGLDSLKVSGVIQARPLASGEVVYSLVQQDQHHLTCLQCGVSITIHVCPVQELESELRRSQQFEIYYHTLEFFGLCKNCQAQMQLPAVVDS